MLLFGAFLKSSICRLDFANSVASRGCFLVSTTATKVLEGQNVKAIEETSVDKDGSELLPRQVVAELDRYIVGQRDAKRAVAVALRNRWRRRQLPARLQDEVHPKNILMIGPTGVGKTEIARRLAKLQRAPFIKVEATKFTEVGFHGKDVDTIVRDLVEAALSSQRQRLLDDQRTAVRSSVNQRLLELLFPHHQQHQQQQQPPTPAGPAPSAAAPAMTRDVASRLEQLQAGQLEHLKVEIEVPDTRGAPPPRRPAPLTDANGDYVMPAEEPSGSVKTRRRKLTVADARPLLEQAEFDRSVCCCC
eukprot:TRINITY_DN1558_c0_g1_i1.p1 TRINITY_DN1558_c0_g1~~TRINITY_DN1558_c0_g1_i1.p1  ORF type:complete len:304 (-),score=102.62 TRINITY_DN1558_c0_g1_i1:724-1635(-)